MIGTLVTHSGAVRVNRQELRMIEPPPGTRTWRPIGHGELIDVLATELGRRDLVIRGESYAIQRQGALLFGAIDLGWRESAEFAAAIGIRTSNDKKFPIQIAIGFRVFVCDNLVFSGDLIALRRKHTGGLDLPREIAKAMDRYQEGILSLEAGIVRLKETALSDSEAKVMIFDAFHQAILPVRFFPAVSSGYFRPPAEALDLQSRSCWSLHNAFTRQIRELPPAPAFQATTRLGRLFCLGQNSDRPAQN